MFQHRYGRLGGAAAVSGALLAATVAAGSASGDVASGQARAAGSTVTIGLIQPYTGDSAYYGQYANQAFKLAEQEYGTSGHTIKLVRGDSKCVPTAAVQAGHQVLAQKPIAILAPACSGDTLALKPLLKSLKVPALSINLAPSITGGHGSYVWRVAPSDTMTNRFFARYIASRGVKRIGIVHDTTGYGQGNEQTMVSALKEAHVKVAADASYDFGDTDYSGQLLSLKKANIDAAYLEGYDLQVGNLIKQARQLGLTVPIYANTNAGNETAIKAGGSAMNGVQFATAFLANSSAANRRIAKLWHDKVHGVPNADNVDLYQGAVVILKALAKAGPNPTGDDLNKAIAKVTIPNMPAGTIAFNAQGDLKNPPVLVGTWRGGKAVLVKKLSGA